MNTVFLKCAPCHPNLQGDELPWSLLNIIIGAHTIPHTIIYCVGLFNSQCEMASHQGGAIIKLNRFARRPWVTWKGLGGMCWRTRFHVTEAAWLMTLVHWLNPPAWKIGDCGFEPHSSLKVLKRQNVSSPLTRKDSILWEPKYMY